MMSRLTMLLAFSFLTADLAIAQSTDVKVSVAGGYVNFSIRSPRPWVRLQTMLFQRYGWLFDYEDPSYDVRETTDHTSPDWIKRNPDNPLRALDPTTETFKGSFVEPRSGTIDEQKTLDSLISQYNQQALTGVFRGEQSSNGRYHIIGSSRYAEGKPALLDKPLRLTFQEEVATARLSSLAHVCSQPGTPVVIAMTPMNYASHAVVKADVSNDNCRVEIDKVLNAMGIPVVLSLLVDPGDHTHYLNISIANALR